MDENNKTYGILFDAIFYKNMPSCVMRFCTNYTGKASKSQDVTYHSFPSNKLRRVRWVDIVRKQRSEEGWQPTNSSKICSDHFKAEDKYKSDKGLTLLKISAFPVVEFEVSVKTEDPLDLTPASPNSLDEEEVSDLEEILDNPETAALKNCIKTIDLQKQNLINKNRNLTKQNKRLRKKVESLKAMLQNLKNQKIEITIQ